MIHKELRNARIRSGLSQAQLAKKMSLKTGGTQYISNFERGVTSLSPVILKKYCTALGVDYESAAFGMVDFIMEEHLDRLYDKYGIAK